MDKIPDYIKKNIDDYVNILNKNGFIIQKAILFGSFANGRYNEFSDIDIAIVSDQFEGIRFNDRKRIRKYKFDVNPDIEPVPFSLTDFTKKDPFVKEIIETGIRII
jgi:uncharacterized protein